MLDGYRRGFQFGAEFAINQPTMSSTPDILRRVFAWLIDYYITQKGWAHFYPIEQAIDGAVDGFNTMRTINTIPTND